MGRPMGDAVRISDGQVVTRSGVFTPTREVLLQELERRKSCRWYSYFPDDGPLKRSLYPKHTAFMRAGLHWKQRALLKANRVGGTDVAAYEIVCHLTGEYPTWWEGKRFRTATEWWAAGDTGTTTRDILQVALLGPTSTIETREWSGMIPRNLVYDISRKPGVPMAVSTIWVRHRTGKISSVEMKSYDQKMQAFYGTAKHGVWLDEESPDDIYGESLMRTMTTEGLMIVTFTPLQGLTPFIAGWLDRSVLEVFDEKGKSKLVPAKAEVFKGIQTAEVPNWVEEKSYLPPEQKGTRYMVMATWDDAPHLSAETKAAMLAEYPPHQRDARSRGIPALGSGVVYPVAESEITVAPFAIPDHWPRCFGMDIDAGVGWTAACWLLKNPETNTFYVYDVYKRTHSEPVIHAEAIKARGAWIPGVADAAALLVTQHDSEQYIALYKRLGLDLTLPDKSVETGIQEVWQLLSSGRLKVFAHCGPFFEEYRLYRRDAKGRVIKQADHVLDALRYAVRSGISRMKPKPGHDQEKTDRRGFGFGERLHSWLGG
jgi:phage terminase large subunit-like protein